MYYFDTFDDALNYLDYYGGYPINTFSRKKDESFEAYRSRIFRTASRIHSCMESYPKEIYSFLVKHPELPQYTFEELAQFTYTELADLRRDLGISKRKKGKKVKSQEPAGSAYQEGRQYVLNTSTSQLAASAIVRAEEPEVDRDEAILTEEEIASMYGEDMPSIEELRKSGIMPEFPHEYEERNSFVLGYNPRKK